MRKRDGAVALVLGGVIIIAALSAVLLGGADAAIPIAAVLVGAGAASIPAVYQNRFKRQKEIRVASLLWRDDCHIVQDWIHRSVRDNWWHHQLPRSGTPEQLALISEGLNDWHSWQPVSEAWRSIQFAKARVSETSLPSDNLKELWRAYDDINRAKVQFTKLDGGIAEPHGQTPEVANLCRPASIHRPPWEEREGILGQRHAP